MKNELETIQALVPAYLDGDLSGSQFRKVKQYLETEEGAEFFQSLCQSWNILDAWECPEVSYNFKAKVFDRVRHEACPNNVMINWRQWSLQLLGLACLCMIIGALAWNVPSTGQMQQEQVVASNNETIDDEILALIEESSISVLPDPTMVAMEESFAWPIDYSLIQPEPESAL